ncbi:MAG: fumarylacetoacetate hydrolase family protein [Bacteroidetes bacterium]|jgi:2-keto-4-pentenoate hydratase/2-oxohepta-3-ene-1,7-dioic acid hydratase in catechol pathway|nr:fumarylacetoacetate hydrolase family protein [Bacteroidota bacterium]
MKIFCVGRNYAEHAKELGNALPEAPVIFMKPDTALLAPGAKFEYPSFTSDLHYEIELVLRIGKTAKNIVAANALSCVDAITVGIDFTARDVQAGLKSKGLPWEKAKAWDNSAIVGEWKPFNAEANADGGEILFSLTKNGQTAQSGTTQDMIYSFETLLEHISGYFTLSPGDLVYTGTPAGVGPCLPGDTLAGFLGDEKLFELAIH